MTRIGIRELRQRASEYLRRVQAGETIEITDQGRPIALLTPVPEASPLDRLRAAGDVENVPGRWQELPPPLALIPGQPAPSEYLARMRGDER